MLKEMIEKIIDLKKPEFFTVGDRTFFTDRYQEMNSENTVDPIEVNTLTSLVESTVKSLTSCFRRIFARTKIRKKYWTLLVT